MLHKKATQQTLAELVFLTSSEAGESACLATGETRARGSQGKQVKGLVKPRPRPQLFSGQTGNLIFKKKTYGDWGLEGWGG